MELTTEERTRLERIIAGQEYNRAKWDCDFRKLNREIDKFEKQPDKYDIKEVETNIEARVESLCEQRFGDLYSDTKNYFMPYMDKLKKIDLLSMLYSFFSKNDFEFIDMSKPDQEILSSVRLALRDYADDFVKKEFGIDPQNPPEKQQYSKTLSPIPYKDHFDMPVDKINNDLFDLLHTESMKKKYVISKPNGNPVYVTNILAPFIPEEEKREEIEKGVALLKESSYSVDVLHAAYQIYRPVKNVEFTAAEVFRYLETYYKNTHAQVPKTSEEEIEKILDAWYNMMIDIGAEEQMIQWHRGDPEAEPKTLTKGNFCRVLPVAFGKASYTNQNAEGIIKKTYIYNAGGIMIPPPSLDYSQNISKQIATFPDRLLESPGKFSGLSKTINTHLLNDIDAMKFRNRSKRILYTTLAHEIGYFRQEDIKASVLDPIPKGKKRTIREMVKKYLDKFKRDRFIAGWKEYPEEGRVKDGVEIILPKQDQQPKSKRKPRTGKKEGE